MSVVPIRSRLAECCLRDPVRNVAPFDCPVRCPSSTFSPDATRRLRLRASGYRLASSSGQGKITMPAPASGGQTPRRRPATLTKGRPTSANHQPHSWRRCCCVRPSTPGPDKAEEKRSSTGGSVRRRVRQGGRQDARLWTPDGIYRDQMGNELKGRPAIEKTSSPSSANRAWTHQRRRRPLRHGQRRSEEGTTEVISPTRPREALCHRSRQETATGIRRRRRSGRNAPPPTTRPERPGVAIGDWGRGRD